MNLMHPISRGALLLFSGLALFSGPALAQPGGGDQQPAERIVISLPDGRRVIHAADKHLPVPRGLMPSARPAPLSAPGQGVTMAALLASLQSGDPEAPGASASGGLSFPEFEWTTFTPSHDTVKVFVSSSEGSDANNGLSPQSPVKTIQKGVSLLRHGYPDWLLLKRGDTWETGLGAWKKSGRSALEPMLISSYGSSTTRPLLKCGNGLNVTGGGGTPPTVGNIAFVGLSFWASKRDPDSPEYIGPGEGSSGFSFVWKGANILVEDCAFKSYKLGLALIGVAGGIQNFLLRGCVIADSYDIGAHSQGIFALNVQGLLVEGCVFDHNGWNEKAGVQPTIFNHNLYLDDKDDSGSNILLTKRVIVRNNIITRAASHGLQLRPGGLCEGNLFIGNAIAMFASQTPTLVRENVVIEPRDLTPTEPRGWGMDTVGSSDIAFERNIVAHKAPGVGNGAAFRVAWSNNVDVTTYNAAFRDNIVFDWHGSMLATSTDKFDRLIVDSNYFQSWSMPAPCVNIQKTPKPSAQLRFSANSYQTASTPNKWFSVASASFDFPAWVDAMNESNAGAGKFPFVDPWRTAATYHGVIGGEATTDAFIAEARKLSKLEYRPELTARPVILYIREGFAEKSGQ